ncbi:MAG: phosphoribosylformylglycinamidine synthase [Spirochaetales bacterium]|nr:phosphoribosylformylglycinamidine synthase [Spirochaetales bacterium]MDP6487878.1 phosphoribosylformylglycinamidine synthase subunit PurS [SAR324 cluster bacterium]MDP6521327.1 phosphoribosylformylglycinamidine synthase subunit PurS [SAR324 cluster bacterium]
MLKGIVTVSLKKDVLDPQGQAVLHSLENLGFTEAENVRIGKSIEVWMDENDAKKAESRLREMCKSLLVNSVIEEYLLEIVEV